MRFYGPAGILCVSAAFILAGCAGSGPVKTRAERTIPRPSAGEPVIVKVFSVSGAAVAAAEGDEPWIIESKKKQTGDYLNAALVAALKNEGLNSMAYIEGAAAPDGALIVDGEVREIGGEARRVSIAAAVRLYRTGAAGDILSEFEAEKAVEGPGRWNDLARTASGVLAGEITEHLLKRTFSVRAE